MVDKLYIARGEVYCAPRAHHPEETGGTEFSEYTLIVSESAENAREKLLSNLKEKTRYTDWKCSEIKELNSGKDIPLEKRVEILKEVLPIIL